MLSDFYSGFEKRADRLSAWHKLVKADTQVAGNFGKKFVGGVKKVVEEAADEDPYKMFKPKPMKSFHGYTGPGTQK